MSGALKYWESAACYGILSAIIFKNRLTFLETLSIPLPERKCAPNWTTRSENMNFYKARRQSPLGLPYT